MTEIVKIKVEPSGGVSGSLTVKDAMHQILDYIELLHAADFSEPAERVLWKLENATTNSSLEVTASAISNDPEISVGFQAKQNAERVLKTIEAFESGNATPEWMGSDAVNIAERFFKRNTNGIGRTDITIGNSETKVIVHSNAKTALLTIKRNRVESQLEETDWTRSEFGSIEGELIAATTYHAEPAIVIKERLSGTKINCVLSETLASEVGPIHNWQETWEHKRLTISGELHYSDQGKLTKIDAESFSEITYEPVDLSKIRKLGLIQELSTDDLHERLWENG